MKPVIFTWLTLAALVETYFLASISGGQPVPHLVLVTVLLVASRTDLKPALIYGLWGGFWLDAIGLSHFGLRSLWLGAWAFLIWWLRRTGVDLQRRSLIVTLASLGSFGFSLSLWLVAWIDTGRWLGLGQFLSQWLVTAILSGGLAWLLTLKSIYTPSQPARLR